MSTPFTPPPVVEDEEVVLVRAAVTELADILGHGGVLPPALAARAQAVHEKLTGGA